MIFLAIDANSLNEDQQEAVAAIERFVRLLVTVLLDDSNLYNAVKHGMATLAGDTALDVTSDATGQGFGVQGASVTFLESSREGNIREWSNTRRWVSIRKAMYLSQLAILEIDALWAIARARYVGAELAGVQALTKETVDSVTFGDMADPSPITRFRPRHRNRTPRTSSPNGRMTDPSLGPGSCFSRDRAVSRLRDAAHLW